MANRFKDLLGAAVPAPRTGGKAAIAARKALVARTIIENCLDGKSTDLAELAASVGDPGTNAVATMTGAGAGGKGANLHKSKEGNVLAVRENVVNLVHAEFLSQRELDALLAERGLDDDGFMAAIAAMPSALK